MQQSFFSILLTALWIFILLVNSVASKSLDERRKVKHDKQVLNYSLFSDGEKVAEELLYQKDLDDVDDHISLYHRHEDINSHVQGNKQMKRQREFFIDNMQTSNITNKLNSIPSNILQVTNTERHKHEISHDTDITASNHFIVNNSSDELKYRLPQALIIGVKKGGTRALLEFLKMHPDIKAPGPEPHFFDKNYDKGYDWYREKMPASRSNEMTIEKTPSYFITKECPARIYNMSRDVKLIVVVRDPVTRAISDYTQGLERRPDMKPFEQMAFKNNDTSIVNISWTPIKIGMYVKHLEMWLKYFPLKQIHFVDGERLISEPAIELQKVQHFLNLQTVIDKTHFSFNQAKGFPCLVKQPNNSQSKPHCLDNSKGRQHPNISDKAMYKLKEFYTPFNQKLYIKLGHNFGW